MLASGKFRPRDDRQLFLELIDQTDLSWKHAAYLLENILGCWEETGTLDAIRNIPSQRLSGYPWLRSALDTGSGL